MLGMLTIHERVMRPMPWCPAFATGQNTELRHNAAYYHLNQGL